MQNAVFYLLLTLYTNILIGCHNPYIVKENASFKDPCVSNIDQGLFVRFKNSCPYPLSKVVLAFDSTSVEFGGLKVGAMSCYKRVPFLWSHHHPIEAWFMQNEKNYEAELMKPVDHVGAEIYRKGIYTITITGKGNFRKRKDIRTVVTREN